MIKEDYISENEILGIKFDLINPQMVLHTIEKWRSNSEKHYITFTNPHSVLLCHRDNEMKMATTNAGLVLPDGIGIILAARILGYSHFGRISGPDMMLRLCDWGRKLGYRHFFYGGSENVANTLAKKLSDTYPGLNVVGTYCPPFKHVIEQEEAETINKINETNPDIVWIGLGAPKQEKWMAEHLGQIEATVMIGVGGAFDFHSGNIKRSPVWFRKNGLEWAYRFAQDPRRMWRRNFDSPLFLSKVIHQLFTMKQKNGSKN